MTSILLIVILGAVISALWQFSFSAIYTTIFELFGIPIVSSDFLSIMLLVQSFLMGALPCILIIYTSKLSVLISSSILLSAIVVTTLLMEIWVGGFTALIGLALSRSAWVFLIGVMFGCFSASMISTNK